jgi:23S rRNA (cytidine1920-2'-O)/16S rRNA (cytidine1409-2'-O)-methyltransferase
VMLGAGRRRAEKPGQMVAEDVELGVAAVDPYVSRGGLKLAAAVEALAVPVAGRRCLDVGASTGGFTDCLLQRGAAHVVALDVAYGELDWRLREDPRVTVLERVNARSVSADQLPYRPELVTIDISFISLTKVLGAVLACCAPGHDVLAMVKPQFEVGRRRVGRGGVVRDPELRRAAVLAVAACARSLGAVPRGWAPAGVAGPAGNRETFLWLSAAGEEVELGAW